MTIERPMFPPRAGKPEFRVVGGIEFAPSDIVATPAPSPRKRKLPKDQQPKEYKDGLPVIDPAGEQDEIFRFIAQHRAAAAHYDRCVDVENEAEGKASSAEFSHLQNNTRNACDQMMLFARCVIITKPTTRRGLIHQARYLASQFTDPDGCNSGGWSLPDKIGENPWPLAFLRGLAAGLRKMAGELDPQDDGERA